MVVELGPIADVLGWVPGTPRVDYAVNDVETLMGVSDVATATDLPAVRTLARLCIWRAAEAWLASRYDITTEGQSLKLSQAWDHAKEMVTRYELEAGSLPGGFGTGSIQVDAITRSADPYAVVTTASEF